MAKISLKSMKALLCVSAALIATNVLAGQDVFNGASTGASSAPQVKMTDKDIDFKAVHLFSVYHKTMLDKAMMAEFEGLRANTNIIPSITLDGLSANAKSQILELYFSSGSPDSQVLNKRSLLLKSKNQTPEFFRDDNIISNLSMNSVAQARPLPESMLDKNLSNSHEKIQCLVTVNASLLGKEHAIYKNVFAKSLPHMSSEQLDSIVAQFIVRHENAHCAQTGEVLSSLSLNMSGVAKEIKKDFATPYTQKLFKNMQNSIRESAKELQQVNYNEKLTNWVTAVKLFKSKMPEKVSESYADGIAMMSLYSQGLINTQTIRDFAAERVHAADTEGDLEHDTSGLLNELASKLDSGQLQVAKNTDLKEIAKAFTPIWHTYVGVQESKAGLTLDTPGGISIEKNASHINAVNTTNINSVNGVQFKNSSFNAENITETNGADNSFKNKLADKIAKIRQIDNPHHGHNHASGYKH